MATTEVNGLMTYIDEAGNHFILYPVTQVENVDGLEDALAAKAPKSHVEDKSNPHNVTAEQVGATPSSHAADKDNPHGVAAAQVGAEPAVESTEYPGCYYRTVDGVVEWLNPPMMDGVEYRMTERYVGKPVYAKLITYSLNHSAGSSGTNVAIPHGISNFGNLVSVFGRIGAYVLPAVEGYDTLTSILTVDKTNITVRFISSQFSGASAYYLYYTKN